MARKEKKLRKWVVTLFNMNWPAEKRDEIVWAETEEDAENKVVDLALGWGVWETRPLLKKGDHVKWNDPAIDDYEPSDRECVRNRVFEITDIDEDYEDFDQTVTIVQVGGGTEAEVYAYELELTEEKPLKVKANIFKSDIIHAEQILIDNGVDADEAQTVLQALGYALLDVELYGNETAVKLHNERV